MIDRRLLNQLCRVFFPKHFLWALYPMYMRNKWMGFRKSSIWPVRLLRLYLHIFAKTLFCLLNWKNHLTACEKHGIMSHRDVFLRRDLLACSLTFFHAWLRLYFMGSIKVHISYYFSGNTFRPHDLTWTSYSHVQMQTLWQALIKI